ncbi:MAG TPA: Hpt domain-containing protein, partial [Pyrinomonadaceae bacterium]|nr:Hpt domain-containing protein [Pyrinomonadaceae bacterium]
MDDRLLSEFLAEAGELIEELRDDIAALRARRGDGRARRELVGRIFRRVHTIKGSATAAGLVAAGELAHEFESLLEALRAGRAAVDEDVLAAC